MSSGSTDTPPEFSAGDTLCAGRFHVVRALGRGGVGWVYLARDQLLDRPVACKIAHEGDQLASDEVRLQFNKLVGITSPNVVKPLGFFVHDTSNVRRPVLALQIVEGDDFATWVVDAPLHDRLGALTAIASGLAELHEVGLVHGDLGGGLNLKVASGNRVVLIDLDSEASGRCPPEADRAALARLLRVHLPQYVSSALAAVLAALDKTEEQLPMRAITAQLRSVATGVPLLDLASAHVKASAASYQAENVERERRYNEIRLHRALTFDGLRARIETIGKEFNISCIYAGPTTELEELAPGRPEGYFVERSIELRASAEQRWRTVVEGVTAFYKPMPYNQTLIASGTSWVTFRGVRRDYLLELRLENETPRLWVAEDPAKMKRDVFSSKPQQRQDAEPEWRQLDDTWIVTCVELLIGRPVNAA
jgi:serine/threonine protein kinase